MNEIDEACIFSPEKYYEDEEDCECEFTKFTPIGNGEELVEPEPIEESIPEPIEFPGQIKQEDDEWLQIKFNKKQTITTSELRPLLKYKKK